MARKHLRLVVVLHVLHEGSVLAVHELAIVGVVVGVGLFEAAAGQDVGHVFPLAEPFFSLLEHAALLRVASVRVQHAPVAHISRLAVLEAHRHAGLGAVAVL